jgi:hypothetical protein
MIEIGGLVGAGSMRFWRTLRAGIKPLIKEPFPPPITAISVIVPVVR